MSGGLGYNARLAPSPTVGRGLPLNPRRKITPWPNLLSLMPSPKWTRISSPRRALSLRFCPANGTPYIDWKNSENLRRFLTPNGKVQGRKKTGLSAREQRMVAQAIKRSRYMGLLPYTSATL